MIGRYYDPGSEENRHTFTDDARISIWQTENIHTDICENNITREKYRRVKRAIS